jgi:hypothetical protein
VSEVGGKVWLVNERPTNDDGATTDLPPDPFLLVGTDIPYAPSPVPADAALPVDEKPFTWFGQWGIGCLDARVFDQGTWWVDVLG